MRATHLVKGRIALAPLLALACVGACLDDPAGVTPPPPPGLVVSDPVMPAGTPTAPPGALSALLSNEQSVVYVSLLPGTEPRGVTATVRALKSGTTLTTAVREGGFDPVSLAAEVGDTIEVMVRDASGAVVLPARIAVARVRPPIVVRTDPPPRKRDVPLNSVMVVVFSEPIDAATLSARTLYVLEGGTTLAGRLEFTDTQQLTAAFVPDDPLSPGTDYVLVVTQGIGDRDGDLLEAAVTVDFTTVTVMATLNFVSVSAGGYLLVPPGPAPAALEHTCGVTAAGSAYCWGSNGNGRLGSSTSSSAMPVAVSGNLTFSSLTAGTWHTCGLTIDGAALCWGNGLELGHGSTTSSSVPVTVAGGLTFSVLSAAFQHTCGLTTNGQAYCWGHNEYGQLGTGSTESSTVPVAVSGGLTFSALSASGVHTCGVAAKGEMYCWGSNSSGQLGSGTTIHSSRPVKVLGQL